MRQVERRPSSFLRKLACFFGRHGDEGWVWHSDNHRRTPRRHGYVACRYCGHVRHVRY